MKRYSIFFALACVLSFVACKEDNERRLYAYTDPEMIAFQQEAVAVTYLPNEQKADTYDVILVRDDASKAFTSDITVTPGGNYGNIFTYTPSVTFNAGEYTAKMSISYNTANFPLGTGYSFTFEVPEAAVSPNNELRFTSLELDLMRDYDWQYLADADIYDSAWFEESPATMQLFKAEGFDYYMLPDYYNEGYGLRFSYDPDTETVTILNGVDRAGNGLLWVNTGSTYQGNLIYAYIDPDPNWTYGYYDPDEEENVVVINQLYRAGNTALSGWYDVVIVWKNPSTN